MPSLYITVTATKLKDLTGALITRGKLTVYATDGADHPTPFRVGGVEQQVSPTITVPIRNGAIAPLPLADPTQTTPINILYHFVFTNDLTGTSTEYPLVTITGPTFALDTFDPSLSLTLFPRIFITGPPGPPGPATTSFPLTVAMTVSQAQVIASVADVPAIADRSILAQCGGVLGVASTGVSGGGLITVQFAGELVITGWTWVGNTPVFLGLNGVLTQTPPTTGFLQIIGTPVNPTTLLIALQPPVLLN